MSASETKQSAAKRQPYEKPVLRSISLVADEVLSVGCKTGVSSGHSIPTCLVGPCYGPGS